LFSATIARAVDSRSCAAISIPPESSVTPNY
jgi:hypothetical protein